MSMFSSRFFKKLLLDMLTLSAAALGRMFLIPPQAPLNQNGALIM